VSFRITTVHAIVGIDDDNEEGVPAYITSMGPMPMIAADERRLGEIKAMAQAVADATGLPFKVARFSVREDIGEIVPSKRTMQ
jgi:hypothetical protein